VYDGCRTQVVSRRRVQTSLRKATPQSRLNSPTRLALRQLSSRTGTSGGTLSSSLRVPCSMIVPRGKVTMVVGPVGCGKSTLLKAVLGELPVMGGSLQVSSLRIALCDQTAWHVNGTVQESIIGVSEFDQRWYSSVVRSCALDEDLRQLPQGDQTQIGSKGTALSGGQSQRIVRQPQYSPRLPFQESANGLLFIGACQISVRPEGHHYT
jgi:ABC-type transport system involved in cytochrome bd biosynthesis fused ATPase/permease subunit